MRPVVGRVLARFATDALSTQASVAATFRRGGPLPGQGKIINGSFGDP